MKQNLITVAGALAIGIMLFIPLPTIVVNILFGIDAEIENVHLHGRKKGVHAVECGLYRYSDDGKNSLPCHETCEVRSHACRADDDAEAVILRVLREL